MNCESWIHKALFGCKITQKNPNHNTFFTKISLSPPIFYWNSTQNTLHSKPLKHAHFFKICAILLVISTKKHLIFPKNHKTHHIYVHKHTRRNTHNSFLYNPLPSSKLSRKRLTHIIINTKNRDLQSLQSLQSQG